MQRPSTRRLHLSKAILCIIFSLVTWGLAPRSACGSAEAIQSGCECVEVKPDVYEGTGGRAPASLR